jgi:hypothetical protein
MWSVARCYKQSQLAVAKNIKGLNLVAVKLTTVQVTKLPLYHRISKIDMICITKPGLTVQKEEFLIRVYMQDASTRQKAKHIHKRYTHPLVRKDVI